MAKTTSRRAPSTDPAPAAAPQKSEAPPPWPIPAAPPPPAAPEPGGYAVFADILARALAHPLARLGGRPVCPDVACPDTLRAMAAQTLATVCAAVREAAALPDDTDPLTADWAAAESGVAPAAGRIAVGEVTVAHGAAWVGSLRLADCETRGEFRALLRFLKWERAF